MVPDNLKSGVVKACLYDPEINRTYADMAAHFGTAIMPTRVRKPRDKAKVEVAVQVVDPGPGEHARPADQAVHLVSLVEQELGQV